MQDFLSASQLDIAVTNMGGKLKYLRVSKMWSCNKLSKAFLKSIATTNIEIFSFNAAQIVSRQFILASLIL